MAVGLAEPVQEPRAVQEPEFASRRESFGSVDASEMTLTAT